MRIRRRQRDSSCLEQREMPLPTSQQRQRCRRVLTGLCVCLCLSQTSSFRTSSFARGNRGIRRSQRPHPFTHTITTTSRSTSTITSSRSMTLVPLEVAELSRLVATGAPTGSQYATYWGRTQQEQYNRLLESAIVSFLGVFFSYFMSFVLGGFVATIFGSLFVFYGILSPEFKAYQRNWEFFGGRALVDPWTVDDDVDPDHAGLYGALFLGRIGDVCIVEDATAVDEFDLEDFDDYNMDTDELERYTGQPYLLRVECVDSTGRQLQLHARLSQEYLEVQAGQPVVGILLSTSPRFTRLAALTDLYVPAAECWIGDYPYLDRAEVESLLAEDDEIWETLQAEEGVVPEDRESVIDDGDIDSENADRRDEVDSENADRRDEESSSSTKDPLYTRRKQR